MTFDAEPDLSGDSAWNEIQLPFSRVIRSFVSGYHESSRIRIKYYVHQNDPTLYARVWFGPKAEGPPHHAHGGAQAAVLDELCGGVAWTHGHPVLAAKLETEFFASVPLMTVLQGFGRILSVEGRKVFTEATIAGQGGEVYARARGLFIVLEQNQLEKLGLDQGSQLTLQNLHFVGSPSKV